MQYRLFLLIISLLITVNVYSAPIFGGTLIFLRSSDSINLEPAYITDGESYLAASQIYETLVTFKEGTTIIEPALAKSWYVSSDGLEYTFNLRTGVYFHKTGYFKKRVEMTAADVVFSFKRQMGFFPDYGLKGKDYFYFKSAGFQKLIKDIKKIDRYTVKFILNRPESPFLSSLAMGFASIVCKEYMDNLKQTGELKNIVDRPIGTGPFIFQSWADGRIRLMSNSRYWNGRPYINHLEFLVVQDSGKMTDMLIQGKAHMANISDYSILKKLEKNKNIMVHKTDGLNVGYLALNMEKRPFNNRQVRQAVNMAVNKDKIIKEVFNGYAVKAKNPIPPTMWSYNKHIKEYGYNPSKAKKLLKKAGYPDGFSTDLWAIPVPRPYNPDGIKVARLIRDDLAKVGIRVKIMSDTWSLYLRKTGMGQHAMALLGWSGDNGDPDNFMYTLLSSDAAVKPAGNIAFFRNKLFDSVIKMAKIVKSRLKRGELYMMAQKVFHEEAPWVPLVHSVVAVPASVNVKGFVLDTVDKRRFNKVWIAADKEKE